MVASLSTPKVERIWEQFRQQVESAAELFPGDEFTLFDGEYHETAQLIKEDLPDAPFRNMKEALKFAVKFN